MVYWYGETIIVSWLRDSVNSRNFLISSCEGSVNPFLVLWMWNFIWNGVIWKWRYWFWTSEASLLMAVCFEISSILFQCKVWWQHFHISIFTLLVVWIFCFPKIHWCLDFAYADLCCGLSGSREDWEGEGRVSSIIFEWLIYLCLILSHC